MTVASHRILVGDVLDKLADLPERSVHCCATSPPFWMLRDYNVDGQIGLEPTIDEYVAKMVEVFGDSGVRRVLRDDGTLWVNLGDSYSSGDRDTYNAGTSKKHHHMQTGMDRPGATSNGLKPLDLCNVPHRVAAALQADDWYWRSTIIWAKGLSFCPEYAGSVMPESLAGWRWERCRVKVAVTDPKRKQPNSWDTRQQTHDKIPGANYYMEGEQTAVEWDDCPGCPKCKPNGGYVLRKGSWRPTSAYEFVFQFAKTANYYADGEAVREEGTGIPGGACFGKVNLDGPGSRRESKEDRERQSQSRNLRNVWVINPQPFPDAHFATFPEKLVEPIIKAATSDKGVCPECGGPWARVIDAPSGGTTGDSWHDHSDDDVAGNNKPTGGVAWATYQSAHTLGWRPTCGCRSRCEDCNGTGSEMMPCDPGEDQCEFCHGEGANKPKPIPATVLDPFVGSGTSLFVARKLGRDSIGIELNAEYAAMAEARVADYAPLFTRPA